MCLKHCTKCNEILVIKNLPTKKYFHVLQNLKRKRPINFEIYVKCTLNIAQETVIFKKAQRT